MKRIISLLAAMAIMAAMVVAMAMPAFADCNYKPTPDGYTCSGGEGRGMDYQGGGGYGTHITYDSSTDERNSQGGYGRKGGGGGNKCVEDFSTGIGSCVGSSVRGPAS